MKLRIFTEPQQGASYAQLLAVAQRAEQLGFDAFFRSDHFLKMGDVNGAPGPSDAWTTLAGISRETSKIRLGTLVNSVTFRHPAITAVSVANVDAMSNGRVELGLGAGWYEAEHKAYGFRFPALGERFDMLGEQLHIINGLWNTPLGETFCFDGAHYNVENSPGLPKPVQTRIPVIVGGRGAKKTPMLAAKYATEFNMPFVNSDVFMEQCVRVREACTSIGRDPKTLKYTVAQATVCGANAAEVEQRTKKIGREVAELSANGLCGTPAQLIAKIQDWKAAGAETIYMQILDLDDLDHLDLIGKEVLPHI
jgi:F420-dependent oxidoreductase-like protein